jgi:hypothetical protein
MRRWLLASAIKVGWVAAAAAQTTPNDNPLLPRGMLGIPVQPSTYLGGHNMMNQDGAELPPSPIKPPPGTMVVHINGRMLTFFGVEGSSASDVDGNKLAPEQLTGQFRLYPGVDALATNGLRYGAIVEIRQNFIGQTYGLSIAPPPGTTNGGAGANYSSSPSAASSASTLYIRREAVYFGSNDVGIFRLGQDDGPFSQLDNGITTLQFGTGAWNGRAPDNIPVNAQPNFPFWSDVGGEFAVSKIVYFSPRFAGLDFAGSFAPNNGANNAAACPVAAAGCVALSSASSANFGGAARPTNWYELMGRYRGNFGGVGVYAIAGYSGSGHVNAPGTQFNGFSVGDAGLALTYAGFTVGSNVLWGNYDGQVALQPKGGVSAIAWLVGAQYVNGPLGLGASYYNYQSQGSAAMVGQSQRYDDGLAAGVNYVIAPGLVAYAEYLYGQVHQGGVNLLGVGTTAEHNDVHSQSFIIGTRVQW